MAVTMTGANYPQPDVVEGVTTYQAWTLPAEAQQVTVNVVPTATTDTISIGWSASGVTEGGTPASSDDVDQLTGAASYLVSYSLAPGHGRTTSIFVGASAAARVCITITRGSI